VDADGSGAVEFPEFCVMMVKKMQENDTENEVRYSISGFPSNINSSTRSERPTECLTKRGLGTSRPPSSGSPDLAAGINNKLVSRMIFRSLPERLSEADIDEMLEAADTDGERSSAVSHQTCLRERHV
jgi:Ca2+-binding EF-hand superfamily protein